ncbi:hypothetical protein HK097_000834 [Rhizophlyctis rosea]|uniref:Uncharacterized protein n=1 Tax=Rhizophlyctis rosea TaxID=64517 RepID=A0AAD5S6V9_9FUNG|nr:hypothetical protein HK097_000834 [Rhizophlyctis rosea]
MICEKADLGLSPPKPSKRKACSKKTTFKKQLDETRREHSALRTKYENTKRQLQSKTDAVATLQQELADQALEAQNKKAKYIGISKEMARKVARLQTRLEAVRGAGASKEEMKGEEGVNMEEVVDVEEDGALKVQL